MFQSCGVGKYVEYIILDLWTLLHLAEITLGREMLEVRVSVVTNCSLSLCMLPAMNDLFSGEYN